MARSWKVISFAVFLVTFSSLASAKSHVPKANTRAAITAYVQQAAAVVQKSGASCATFATADWKAGEYYIFVVGPDGKVACHPDAKLIGQDQSAIATAKGDKFGERIAKMGTAHGKGWVDYLWARPGKTVEEPKSSYVMGVTGPGKKHYIVGSGAWGLGK